MEYKIISGGRRWSICKKHGIKVPVIFKKYKSEIDKIVDSVIENDTEELTRKELEYAVNTLREKGLKPEKIASILGITTARVYALLTPQRLVEEIIEEEDIPEEDLDEFTEIIEELEAKPRTKRVVDDIARLTGVEVGTKDYVELVKDVGRLPLSELEEQRKEIGLGMPIDREERKKIISSSYVLVKYRFPPELQKELASYLRRRNWDAQRFILTVLDAILFDHLWEPDHKYYKASRTWEKVENEGPTERSP